MLRAIGSAASGSSPVVFQADTYANRANYQTSGNIVRFTDVGGGTTGVGGGTFWFYNSLGTPRWKLVNNSADIDNIDTLNAGVANTTPQNLNPNAAVIQAGVIQGFDRLVMELGVSKSASVDTGTLVIRIGTTFTVADAAIGTLSLAGAAPSAGFRVKFKRLSATTIQMQGSSNVLNSWGGTSTGSYATAVALSGADSFDTTAMKISLWQTMTAGTEFLTIQDFESTLQTTDS